MAVVDQIVDLGPDELGAVISEQLRRRGVGERHPARQVDAENAFADRRQNQTGLLFATFDFFVGPHHAGDVAYDDDRAAPLDMGLAQLQNARPVAQAHLPFRRAAVGQDGNAAFYDLLDIAFAVIAAFGMGADDGLYRFANIDQVRTQPH